MRNLVYKYIQVIVVTLILFLVIIFKNKVSFDEDTMAFLNDTFRSPVADQKAKTNIKNRKFIDGVYKGEAIDAYYGYIQVEVTVTDEKISDLAFLQYPYDNTTSEYVNVTAMPILRSEALEIQDSNVDIVSGASNSSRAFRKSLESALLQAQ